MQTFDTRGIVFRNIKYGESSIICDIFTLEKGLRSYIVSGVRSSKSKNKANIYRPLNIIEMTAYDSNSEKLTRIKEIRYAYVFESLNVEVIKSSMALFMLEIARNAIKSNEPEPDLYRFIENSLVNLDKSRLLSSLTHIKFMIDLSSYLGFEPMRNYSETNSVFDLLNGKFEDENSPVIYRMDKETSLFFFQLLKYHPEETEQLTIPKSTRMLLMENLIIYYRLHLTGFKEILSKDVLSAVL